MKAEIPVFMTKVECPVCKTVNEFETIKLGAYTEEGRDTDFRPTGIMWRNSRYQHINPLLYFMASCSSCFYTRELTKAFKEWKNDSAFRDYRQKPIREQHLIQLARPGGIVKALGGALKPTVAPNETAIIKLILGITCEKYLEHPSALDLGRWYLRIGWLFRERGEAGVTSNTSHNAWRLRVTEKLSSLRSALRQSDQLIQELRGMFESESEGESPVDDPYRQAAAQWRSCLDPILQSVDDMLLWGDDRRPSPRGSGGAEQSFGESSSLQQFLQQLSDEADEIPTSEEEALFYSLKYYRQAYRASRSGVGSNQKIQLAYMVGELARRVGELNEAREFFNVAIRTGHELIHQFRHDESKTALARKIVEMASDQARLCRETNRSVRQ